jgi:hypothetical protein
LTTSGSVMFASSLRTFLHDSTPALEFGIYHDHDHDHNNLAYPTGSPPLLPRYAIPKPVKRMDCYSPAVSVTSDMTDEELDKYFATYVPLSNLPTPPPAKQRLQPETTGSSTSSTSPPRSRTPFSSSSELQGTSLQPSSCHHAPFSSCRTRCWKLSRWSRTAPVSFPCINRAWSHVILCPTTPSLLLTSPLRLLLSLSILRAGFRFRWSPNTC